MNSFQPPIRVLMGPGPSDMHARVLAAMSRPVIGHLDPRFVEMMDDLKALLRVTFKTENELTFPLSAPGSAGMETCFVNLVEPGEKVVVCINGVFGQRMTEIVKRIGAVPITINTTWGHAIEPERVEQTLAEHPDAKVLAFVHAETSTGALSDAKTLAAIAHRHGCLVILDAVTSLGGCPVEIDEWGIDAVYAGSQKCLSCTPGLSPLSFNARAIDRIERRQTPVPSWFLDLNLVMGYWKSEGRRSYHHTAPIHALYGLHEALVMLQEEGLAEAWSRHRRFHQQLVEGLAELGLEMAVAEGERIPQLNAVRIPQGVDGAAIRGQLLSRFGLEIGAGLGPLAGQIWRIGLMGQSCRENNVLLCLNALKSCL